MNGLCMILPHYWYNRTMQPFSMIYCFCGIIGQTICAYYVFHENHLQQLWVNLHYISIAINIYLYCVDVVIVYIHAIAAVSHNKFVIWTPWMWPIEQQLISTQNHFSTYTIYDYIKITAVWFCEGIIEASIYIYIYTIYIYDYLPTPFYYVSLRNIIKRDRL